MNDCNDHFQKTMITEISRIRKDMNFLVQNIEKDISKNVYGIKKNLDSIAKYSEFKEKVERIKIGLSSLNIEFPEYKEQTEPNEKNEDNIYDIYIIAVDFDGTLVTNAYPEIGEPVQSVINYVKDKKENGAKIILWTNRNGSKLREAVLWCEQNDIHLDAVNENLTEMIDKFGDTRKIFAHEYIDDRSFNPFYEWLKPNMDVGGQE